MMNTHDNGLTNHVSNLILLIEDDIDHAELIIRTTKEHPIRNRVLHFHDGNSALDYLFRRNHFNDPDSSPRPKVILLDMHLPGVDGIDILRTIKASDELNMIPVIMLTSSAAEMDITRAYCNHANSYLVKPMGWAEFKELMDNLCCYWLGNNMNSKVQKVSGEIHGEQYIDGTENASDRHMDVIKYPTGEWMVPQLQEATLWGRGLKHLIRERDSKAAMHFSAMAISSGIKELKTPYRTPQANGITERFMGSLRRECLDQILFHDDRHVQQIVKEYIAYFNQERPHQAIRQLIPDDYDMPRSKSTRWRVGSRAILGGLHHSYSRATYLN